MFLCMCLRVHMFICLAGFCLCVACFIYLSLSRQSLPPEPVACVLLCICVHRPCAVPFPPASWLVWLPVNVLAPAVTPLCDSKSQRGPTVCAESENYHPSFKDCLHCCSTGTPLCSHFVIQCLLTNPRCKSRQSTSSRLCVLWCCGSCLLRRMHVYSLPDIL